MTMYRAIIGLGNPGRGYHHHRHTIGFRVLDALASAYASDWQKRPDMEVAEIRIHEHPIILIKPQTFMNDSGKVIPMLLKKGIKAEQVLVVHDELEKSFGHLSIKVGGSAKGHNGLRSIIQQLGMDFARLKVGIGRPENKEDVGTYVLSNFSPFEEAILVQTIIPQALTIIEKTYQ